MACHAGRYFPGCRCCVSRLLFVFFFCILLPVVIYYRSWRRCLIASSASLIVLYLWKAYVVFVFCHWACEFDSLTACHLVCTLSGTTSKTCTTWIPSSSNPSKSSTTGPGWAGRGTVFCVISKCLLHWQCSQLCLCVESSWSFLASEFLQVSSVASPPLARDRRLGLSQQLTRDVRAMARACFAPSRPNHAMTIRSVLQNVEAPYVVSAPTSPWRVPVLAPGPVAPLAPIGLFLRFHGNHSKQ